MYIYIYQSTGLRRARARQRRRERKKAEAAAAATIATAAVAAVAAAEEGERGSGGAMGGGDGEDGEDVIVLPRAPAAAVSSPSSSAASGGKVQGSGGGGGGLKQQQPQQPPPPQQQQKPRAGEATATGVGSRKGPGVGPPYLYPYRREGDVPNVLWRAIGWGDLRSVDGGWVVVCYVSGCAYMHMALWCLSIVRTQKSTTDSTYPQPQKQRRHPCFDALPHPSALRPPTGRGPNSSQAHTEIAIETPADLSLFRQESWEWDALHVVCV